MEKILRFEDLSNHKRDKELYGSFDGFRIVTDKQTIEIGISNGQSCCEDWGYLSSEDDYKDFIGATLYSIKKVNTSLKVQEILDNLSDDETGVMFINLETSNGTLQFTVYNSHNGYYGHSVYVKSTQLNIENSL